MGRVAIVYHSGTGTTKIMADAVLRGAGSVAGTDASIHEIAGEQITDGRWSDAGLLETLDAADAIVLGCPTYMGGVSAQLKSFLDATLDRWYPRTWKDKIGAGFTVSSTPSGDKLNTLVSLSVFAMQMGMIWVGHEALPMGSDAANRLSVYLGAAGQADYQQDGPAIHSDDVRAGEHLGARVATITNALCAGRGAGS